MTLENLRKLPLSQWARIIVIAICAAFIVTVAGVFLFKLPTLPMFITAFIAWVILELRDMR